jgi:hypothetical protein
LVEIVFQSPQALIRHLIACVAGTNSLMIETVTKAPIPPLQGVFLGIAFAVFLSYGACLVLAFGLIGSAGNSIATGMLLLLLPITLFLLSHRDARWPNPGLADGVFFALVVVVLLSFLANAERAGSTKEYLLLVSTFAGYVATRRIDVDHVNALLPAFKRTTAIIVMLGACFTADEMVREWNGPSGKPLVFGFNAAGTYFTQALSVLTIALVSTDDPSPRRTALISALLFLPAAIFAAAMVRFTFIALAGGLLIATIVTESGKRRHVVAVALVLFFAIGAGLAARPNFTMQYASYVLDTPYGLDAPVLMGPSEAHRDMPSCRLTTNMRNSIAIREALAMDALYLIPGAGFIGTGLDSFMQYSCIKAHEVHVSVLQMAVEFGWLGGGLFLVLIAIAIGNLVPTAKRSCEARFILCALSFMVMVSLAHGRVSRDGALFALLGCAVGIMAQPSRSAAIVSGMYLTNHKSQQYMR